MTDVFIWVGVMILMVVLEIIFMKGKMIWMALGALLAALTALFDCPVWVQCPVFFTVSMVFTLFAGPIILKLVDRKMNEKKASMPFDIKEENKEEQQ